MNYGREQQKEIKTIKERMVSLKLSDADCVRISEYAGRAGLTVGELLESFIGDLVEGTYTNGSDERMYADQWYERCGYGEFSEKTFLKYLIEHNSAEDFAMHYELKKDCETELLEFTDQEELENSKEELEFQNEQLQEYYAEYTAENEDAEPFEEASKKVYKWYMELKNLKN